MRLHRPQTPRVALKGPHHPVGGRPQAAAPGLQIAVGVILAAPELRHLMFQKLLDGDVPQSGCTGKATSGFFSLGGMESSLGYQSHHKPRRPGYEGEHLILNKRNLCADEIV